MDKLKQQKLILISVERKGFDLNSVLSILNKQKVTTKDVSIFCRQFSVMISAGLKIMEGLSIIAEQTENRTFGELIRKIKDDIGSGTTLADAMGKFPKTFNNLFVNMIRSGEQGGILDTILDRLSTYLEKNEALKGKIKSAMTYPAVVVMVVVGVVIFLLVKVIPTFRDVFASFGAQLPGPTQFVVNLSEGLVKYLVYMVIAAVGAFLLFRVWVKTERGRFLFDKFLLGMPIFGILLRKSAVARFTRTLGTLIKSGVNISEALETVARTAGNTVVEKAILQARESIRAGEGIVQPLKQSKVFPVMVTAMVAVGEETGALDEMLLRIADFYDEEVDTAVAGLTALLEPLIIVFLGGTVGGMVVAMFLPMFSLGTLVG